MKFRFLLFAALTLAVYAQPPQPAQKKGPGGGGRGGPSFPALDETGYKTMFDGKSLAGWDCDPDFWRVENGVMVGETKADHQPKQNIFCIWRGGTGGDFHLKLDYKITGGNSGIQYRSIELPEVNRWVLKGYQADIDAAQQYTGQVYEERGRGFLSLRGQINYVGESKRPFNIGSVGPNEELKALIKNDDWNAIEIVARGNTIAHLINGRVMSVLVDDDKAGRKLDGLIGIQLHLTNTGMKIEARNIRIKEM